MEVLFITGTHCGVVLITTVVLRPHDCILVTCALFLSPPTLRCCVLTVDDGTGVINCLCWKSDVLKEEREPSKCEFMFVSQS